MASGDQADALRELCQAVLECRAMLAHPLTSEPDPEDSLRRLGGAASRLQAAAEHSRRHLSNEQHGTILRIVPRPRALTR